MYVLLPLRIMGFGTFFKLSFLAPPFPAPFSPKTLPCMASWNWRLLKPSYHVNGLDLVCHQISRERLDHNFPRGHN